MKPLVECVPNFSEGRRPEVVQAIVAEMVAVAGVHVLDVSSDVDHNRTVVTVVGPPVAVEEAVFRAIARAATLIDLEVHQGEHPRLGATDVVPFVPLRGVTMEECVALAHDLGRRVAEELGIPVYFYEQAALRPDRVPLENVRRGGYELLKQEIGVNPDRAPDLGPRVLGKAGATIIGARPFLIAFNVYLSTAHVGVARKIARAVRHSSGGFRYLKALGLSVAGQAQVSMNFTDFRRTPIHRVVETIRREAARYGVTITHTELVGMIPEQALIDAAQWYLQLERLQTDQILECRLSAMDEGVPLGFVDAVAAKEPTPGGGAVAALAGALAAALAAMIGRITVGRRRYAAVSEAMAALIVRAERLRAALAARVAEDTVAFDAVLTAKRLPRHTPEEREVQRQALQTALLHAIEVPLRTARDAVAVLELVLEVAREGNVNAVADAGTAAWMAMAAVQGAILSARANAVAVEGQPQVRVWMDELHLLEERAQALLTQVQEAVSARGMLGAW